MTIAEFDHFEIEKKKELLRQCCNSSAWVNKMLTVFPVEDLVELMEDAEEKWYECTEEDWKEAFSHESKSMPDGTLEKILQQLEDENKKYKEKFSYTFIVSATGKSAEDILNLLQSRFLNSPEEEIKIAMEEQNMIIKIRLEKLFA
ncbi:MAG: 2-oxo-4-hydroxy-4-carboxy-5-ureidoimidazoline decarboxylase [Ginsengibacter sp.]